ncbi:MAG: WbqC family protein [Bacteroidia bacterium]|nr:WbqC family protein [Bacteroidia bacterium]
MESIPVFSVQYFGNILFYVLINQYPKVYIETSEYYIKQTFRNRTIILTANGLMPLIIPVIHKSSKELIVNKEISYKEPWQKKHYTAITSAYKNAPFFEFYANELLEHITHSKYPSLFLLNLELMKKIFIILNISTEIILTTEYKKNYTLDYRNYFDKHSHSFFPIIEKEYIQVFSDRFPFQKNISILDLIFNLGPDSANYIAGTLEY